MHKSEQKIEQKIERTYRVDGPTDSGYYRVTDPEWGGFIWSRPNEFATPEYNEAVKKHIESLPKPPNNWTAYLALRSATLTVGRAPSATPLLHEYTDLTADEAITLMELLNKITKGSRAGTTVTTPRPQDRDTTLERRLIVTPDGAHLVIVESEPDVWFYEDEDGDSRYNYPSDVDGKPGEIVMLLDLT